MRLVSNLLKHPLMIGMGGIASVVVVVLISYSLVRAQEEEPELPVVHMQTIGRSMTKGEVTVHFQELVHSSEKISAKFSYRSSDANTPVDHLLKGFDLIRAEEETKWGTLSDANGLTELSSTGHEIEYRIDGADEMHAIFPMDKEIQDGREHMSISLGSYIVAQPDLSGNVNIDLGSDYESIRENHIPASRNPTRVPLDVEFTIGGGRYKITELVIYPQVFRLVVEPVDEEARRRPFGVISPSKMMSVTYEDGTSYNGSTGVITYDDLNPRGFKFQQVIFEGFPPKINAPWMTLTVRGGAEIVGPFVFEDIPVIAEEIYRVEYTPPTVEEPATPTPVPILAPTVAPEPTPAPTPVPSLAVQNLRAEEAPGTITLTWDVPDSDDVLGYEILRQVLGSADAQTVASLNSDATSYVDTDGLQSGTGYAYTVRTTANGVTGETKAYIKVLVP